MSAAEIITKLDQKDAIMWGNEPVCIGHSLHQHPLFSLDALGELIERYPRESYGIFSMGSQKNESWYWRQGDLDGMKGRDVIEAIKRGRLWLNLRTVNKVDKRYGDLLDELMDELSKRMPGFEAKRKGSGILISSPMAQVYYHVDLPGQLLFQIAGRKKLYFYPAHAPFITNEQLEHTAITGLGVDIKFEDWYDEYATEFEFEPGQMVHWPHFAPHRVVNHDVMNISMTVDFSTAPILRRQMVNYANGILQHGLGWTPRSRSTSGVPFWTKAVLQKTLREAPWIKKQKTRNEQIEFRLDRTQIGAIVDFPAAAE